MISSTIVILGSVIGIALVSIACACDRALDKTRGATGTVALLMMALACGVSGRWVPEGAVSVILAALVWILTVHNSQKGHKA